MDSQIREATGVEQHMAMLRAGLLPDRYLVRIQSTGSYLTSNGKPCRWVIFATARGVYLKHKFWVEHLWFSSRFDALMAITEEWFWAVPIEKTSRTDEKFIDWEYYNG